MVYKLVEIKGEARIKFSEELEKTTLPGSKCVARAYLKHEGNEQSGPSFDIICLAGEDEKALSNWNPDHKLKVWSPFAQEGVEFEVSKIEIIQTLLFEHGKEIGPTETLNEQRERSMHEF